MNDLPDGWAGVALKSGVIVGVQPGFACGVHNREGEGIAHLRPMNVSTEGRIDLSDIKYVPAAEVDREERWLTSGDVLFNNTNSPELVGKTAFYSDSIQRAFSNHMTRVRCRTEFLDPRFCALVLHHKWQIGYFQSICNNHVSQASVGRAALLDTDIPLPPVAEQRRIVVKVEALLERVQATRERLARVPLILKRFRQAIHTAACTGTLTTDWRDHHVNVEPAQQLIARLRSVPCSDSDFPAEEWRDRDPPAIDASELPEIPSTWTWIRLPDTGYMNRGRSRNRPRNAPHLYGGPYPFIQTGDIARSGGRITNHQQTYSEAGLAQSRLWPIGTICITIAANIADSALLTYPACFPDSVVGIVTDKLLCSPEYVEYFVRTAREDLSQFAPATAQKNINIGILEEVAVPLPPREEQAEIVRRVDSLLKLADAVERRLAAARVRADKLTQAILAKAFRGELVPTEADLARAEGREYETAEQLLARIAATRTEPTRTTRKPRVIHETVEHIIDFRQDVSMRNLSKESVMAAVAKMKTAEFTFDDLRKALPSDYEGLKQTVFDLLQEPNAELTQRFDETTEQMKLVRRQK